MFRLIEGLAAAVVLIPLFLLLWKVRFHDLKKTILYAVFAIYLAAVYFLVGLPTVQFFTFDVNLNLIPFAGMIADMKNAILNVVLFVPLGCFLPLLWAKFRNMRNTLYFGLKMTVAIELLQLFTYRATDINDVITNFLGTWLGYLLFSMAEKLALGAAARKQEESDLCVILIAVIAVMFFIQPYIVSLIYAAT